MGDIAIVLVILGIFLSVVTLGLLFVNASKPSNCQTTGCGKSCQVDDDGNHHVPHDYTCDDD